MSYLEQENSFFQKDCNNEYLKQRFVALTYYGHNHGSYNLQGVPNIVRSLEQHLSESKGTSILYWESIGNTSEQAQEMNMVVGQFGYRGALLHYSLQNQMRFGAPSKSEVRRRLQDTAYMDSFTVLKRGFISPTFLHDYTLACMLDKLRTRKDKKYKFIPEFEAHSLEAIRNFDRLKRVADKYAKQANQYWDTGNWEQFLQTNKLQFKTAYEAVTKRDQENFLQLQQLINSLLENSEGGSIFMLFGKSHELLGKNLQVANLQNTRVLTNIIRSDDLLDFSLQADLEIGANDNVSDNTVAHAHFAEIVYDNIALVPTNPLFQTYAGHYEDIKNEVCEIVAKFSINDIQKFCETHQNLYSIFKTQPLSPLLQQFT